MGSVTVSFVDGEKLTGASSVEVEVDETMTLGQVIQGAFAVAERQGCRLPSGISPHPWLVGEPLRGMAPEIVPMLDFIGVDKDGRGYLRGPHEDLPWNDFERGLDFRDPQVQTRHIAVSNAGGFGGGSDYVGIGSLLHDLFGETPRWRRFIEPARRLLGDRSPRWPAAKVAEQAQDFVHRGLPDKDSVQNFTRISTRWDPVRYGELLGLTEREATYLLEAVDYREAEHGLWIDGWVDVPDVPDGDGKVGESGN